MAENSGVGKKDKQRKPWINRYVSVQYLIAIAIVIYVMFFSDYSIQRYYSYDDDIKTAELKIKENTDSFNYYNDMNMQLKSNPQKMEEIVREKYHMHRENEEVYVFE